MKISTRGIYGLKAMVDLAVNSANESITIKSISERQNISESYLEQIFSILSKKGIIKSKKGAQGGYNLGKIGYYITVGDILRALEGDLSVVAGKDEEGKMDRILWNNIWNKMNENINNVVDNITLKELAEEYSKLDEDCSMYYI